MASMAFANYKQRTAQLKVLDQEKHSFQERDCGVVKALNEEHSLREQNTNILKFSLVNIFSSTKSSPGR